jgi:hypothetical protein
VDLATRLLRLRRGAHASEQEKPPLAACPGCRSELVQPQGWKELSGGGLVLHLRCPECMVFMSGSFEPERVAEYDAALVRGRASILADYEAIVRHNMKQLSQSFERALELDLIGPDDFAVGPAAAPPKRLSAPRRRVESI